MHVHRISVDENEVFNSGDTRLKGGTAIFGDTARRGKSGQRSTHVYSMQRIVQSPVAPAYRQPV